MRARGFTLLELGVALGIAAALAAVAGVAFVSAMRNANLSSATYDLAVRLAGLRATAMADGHDQLFVFLDAPGSDASSCSVTSSSGCSRYLLLSNPGVDWSISTFDPSTPGGSGTSTAEVREIQLLPTGAHLDLSVESAPIAAPFTAVSVHDPDLLTTCGGRLCFAVRFTARGEVRPELTGGPVTKVGYAFILGTGLDTSGANHRGIVVTFPSGIVKTFAF